MNLRINFVKIIDEQIKNGKFFSITWVKKNGELRKASVKKCKWINTSGIARKHPDQYICLVDMNKLQKNGNGYVLINKESILSVKANGKVYTDWIKTMFAQNLGLIEIGTL
jgi:hypothetical protein